MTEEQNTEMSKQEMFEALVNQLQQTVDPRDYMTPTQREIAYMTPEQLETEYQLVQSKQSSRGRMQRDLIVSRYEFEQQNPVQDESI